MDAFLFPSAMWPLPMANRTIATRARRSTWCVRAGGRAITTTTSRCVMRRPRGITRDRITTCRRTPTHAITAMIAATTAAGTMIAGAGMTVAAIVVMDVVVAGTSEPRVTQAVGALLDGPV